MQTNDKQYYIFIQNGNQKIPVTKEEFDAFYKETSVFRRRQMRQGLCSCPKRKWLYCDTDCENCRYRFENYNTYSMDEPMTMLRSEAFRDMPAAGWRFESAAVTTPQLAKARGYAQNWDEFKKAGIGLLLFGNVGTGKSYAAGCVANALIDRLESVLFVGMSDVVNRMQGNFGADRDHYMKSLMRPDLLILDDLGAERNTSFGKERVFDVVDKRLLTGKPMIVTTNIPLSVMKQAVDLDDRRIYDRILEVCVPIMFDGDSFRKSTAADNLKTAARLLG